MVHPFLIALFSPLKPSSQASARPSAFSLNVASNPAVSVTSCLQLFSVLSFARTCSRNVSPAQVNSNYFRSFTRWRRVYLHYKVDVVVALTSLIQRCRGQVLPSKQSNLIPANGHLKVDSPRNKGNSYGLFVLHILKCADVQGYRSRSKNMDLFTRFGVANYSSNSLTDMVSFKPCTCPNCFIDFVVQLSCVVALLFFSYYQYLIASIRKPFQSAVNFLTHLRGDYQLALYRYRLSHRRIITHLATKHEGILKYPVSFFLPRLKPLGFQTPARFL